jgi:hypothetical protein
MQFRMAKVQLRPFFVRQLAKYRMSGRHFFPRQACEGFAEVAVNSVRSRTQLDKRV